MKNSIKIDLLFVCDILFIELCRGCPSKDAFDMFYTIHCIYIFILPTVVLNYNTALKCEKN